MENNEIKNEEKFEKKQEPLMRLYGINGAYFKTINEIMTYCKKYNKPIKDIFILDYYRSFNNKKDVIKRVKDDISVYYAVCSKYEYCWYSEDLIMNDNNWENKYGQIEDLYKPFRDYGIVFEDDIYEKERENHKKLLKKYQKVTIYSHDKDLGRNS